MDSVKLTIALVSVVLTLSACAKKDSNFAERYAKSRAGATVVDGVKTQLAAESAAQEGLEADIVDVTRTMGNMGFSGPRIIRATILINQTEFPVTSVHQGTEVVHGSVDVNGYSINYHAWCSNYHCNPYYAAMEVYKNSRLVIQEGIRIYFDKTSPEHQDVYQWFSPGNELPLLGADAQDVRGMVGFLNQAEGSNTSLIK